jgi:hypothetical protein
MASLLKYSGTFSDEFLNDGEIEKAEAARDRILNADAHR